MQMLDGNALAGPLAEVLTGDATSAVGRCMGCGDVAALAQAVVYASAGRYVARCRNCDDVLLTVIETDTGLMLTMDGIAAFRMPAV